MKIDQNMISRVAKLSRLELSDDEKAEFSKQLSEIISYVEKINELQTENIEPTDHIVDLKNVFRKDEVGKSIDIKRIEEIAPKFREGHIVVPQIIEES